jgi:hypothetical protein
MPKLREGQEYKFLVERELTLPDNSRHFMLKGPDSKKYLLPYKRYSHYQIPIGTEVKCRIDKINCKGEVFLEPQNPWYREGKSYYFIVDGIAERMDNSGINHKVIIVLDKSGNKISIRYDDTKVCPVKGSRLNLKVERITKGKIHLVSASSGKSEMALKTGSYYEFVIERIAKGMDNKDYYVIKDPFGKHHTLSIGYYKNYGFDIGTRFRGRIVKHKKNGEKIIEPDNPFYKIGSEIIMEVKGFIENPVNQLYIIKLVDEYSFTHYIETSAPLETKLVLCEVVMIKKGKPLLELL